jgi:aspartate-semialdehyde dehydrogenase
MSSTGYSVGIVGCTGAVGKEMISTLYRRKCPMSKLSLFASERSAGKKCETPNGEITITLFSVEAARECDIVFLAVSGSFAKEHAKSIAAQPNGAVVIDNSSAFRYDEDIPLVVPEINCEAAQGQYLIANPNCTTAIASVVLWPIHQTFGIEKVMISTYQASSGAGAAGMSELLEGTAKVLEGKKCPANTFSHPLAFNVIPHIDSFQDNGYTREELKVVWETRKIFNLPNLPLSCTAVRVPTLRAHAESIIIATRDDVSPEGKLT